MPQVASSSQMPKMAPSQDKGQPKTWQIISAVLAIALIAVLAFFIPQVASGNKNFLSADKAASDLVDFINTIYGPQLGTVTLNKVSEENGLYKVEISIPNNTQQPEQTVFVTKDGKLFIPQVIDVDQVMTDYQNYQNQAAQQPTDSSTTPPETQPAQ